MDNARAHSSALPIVLLTWFAGAATFAATVAITELPRLMIPPLIMVPTGAVLLAYFKSPTTRVAVDAIDVRWLVALHMARAPIGVAFLIYESRGELIRDFAFPAGVGDIVAGVFAVVAVRALPAVTHARYRLVRIWCIVGLIDMVMVVVSAQRVLFFGNGPNDMRAFDQFPFPMLPVFLVPLIISTHVIILSRLRAERAYSSA